MRMIDAAAVDALLDYPGLIDALEAGHRAGVDTAERLVLAQPGAAGLTRHLLVWPAWQWDEALGVKLVTSFPDNAGGAFPTVQGVYVLFDGRSGAVSALIDGTAMTPWKTAADSALGARFLAREDCRSLLMVGAGVMAPHLIRAHLAARPAIGEVTVWNRTPETARALAAALQEQGIAAGAGEDLEAAARRADLISCATGATRPLIRGDWLRSGCHLDLVGGFTPEMREADDEACRRAEIYVDSRWFTLGYCGDLTRPMEDGVVSESDIRGDLFELCQGRAAGRAAAEDVTLFKNGGGAHLDLMTGRHILDRARARSG
ncbi:MAG: ornithine cyclodeaminase family protein [Kiloniellales bacterium]|nr:ornithine cyclodeaminase family protein [Kiloniellales bacterium]